MRSRSLTRSCSRDAPGRMRQLSVSQSKPRPPAVRAASNLRLC
jgi:hypothetical protein